MSSLFNALTRRRYPITAWPWRALAYLVSTTPIAFCVAVGWAIVATPWVATAGRLRDGRPLDGVIVFGMVVTAGLAVTIGPLLAVPLAALERVRMLIVDNRPVRSGHRPVNGNLLRWLRVRYTESATWREVAYSLFLAGPVNVAYGTVAVLILVDFATILAPFFIEPGGAPVKIGFTEFTSVGQAAAYAIIAAVLLPAVPYLLGLLAAGHAAVARALLGDSGGGTALVEVARSRARLVGAYEAERRRIERDLHDGAQHRLTSLTLQLGMARLDVPEDSPAAAPLAAAHQQAKDLMVVLREVIAGIRPQTLVDLGLAGALRELAARSPIPVTVNAPPDLAVAPPAGPAPSGGPVPGRLPEPVETTAYFVASEALGNVARHAGATGAEVTLTRAGRTLVMEVRDNGRGGADPVAGTGLTGLADRVAAVNGRLLLSSPPGGPTIVRVELPCDQ
jgi:signal transduction histidine kinase